MSWPSCSTSQSPLGSHWEKDAGDEDNNKGKEDEEEGPGRIAIPVVLVSGNVLVVGHVPGIV